MGLLLRHQRQRHSSRVSRAEIAPWDPFRAVNGRSVAVVCQPIVCPNSWMAPKSHTHASICWALVSLPVAGTHPHFPKRQITLCSLSLQWVCNRVKDSDGSTPTVKVVWLTVSAAEQITFMQCHYWSRDVSLLSTVMPSRICHCPFPQFPQTKLFNTFDICLDYSHIS